MITIATMDVYYYDMLLVVIASFFDVVMTFYTLYLDEKINVGKPKFKELNPVGRFIMKVTNNNKPVGLIIMGLFAQAVLWGGGWFGAGVIYPFFQGVFFIILWTHLHNISSLHKVIARRKVTDESKKLA